MAENRPAYMPSDRCFAYEILKKQIGQQCDIYGRLHQKEDLGSLPGMYKNEEGRDIPSDDVSAFFRGGIITTMACFEAYVVDLLEEACDTILYKRIQCRWTCPDCLQLKYEHVKTITERSEQLTDEVKLKLKAEDKFQKTNSVLLHSWNAKYEEVLGKDVVEKIFETSKDIKYNYPVDDKNISKVVIKDEFVVCAILRLFYGIRCIMGHGNAEATLTGKNGALSDFPKCKKNSCEKNSCKKSKETLAKIYELSNSLDKCIEEQGKKKVLKTSRHFPQQATFERLSDASASKKALDIIVKYFPERPKENNNTIPIDENYAYFHMCRILHWLKENKRMMYVTYRVLVRINQFILVLAYRMRIAVAQILMEKYGLEDGIWNVPKDKEKLKKKIGDFEKEHEKRVKRLQKHDGAENRVVENMQRKYNYQMTFQNDMNNKQAKSWKDNTVIVLLIISYTLIIAGLLFFHLFLKITMLQDTTVCKTVMIY